MGSNNNYIKKRKSMESISEDDHGNIERPTSTATPYKILSNSPFNSSTSSPRSFVSLFKKPSSPKKIFKKQQDRDSIAEDKHSDSESTSSKGDMDSSDEDEEIDSEEEQEITLLDEVEELKKQLAIKRMQLSLIDRKKKVKQLKRKLVGKQKEIEHLKQQGKQQVDDDDEEFDSIDEEQAEQEINKLEINEEDDNSEFALKLYNRINENYNFYRTTSVAKGGFKVQEEFVKFIVLKIMDQDYESLNADQVQLIAPPLIQNYWKTLALDTKEYQRFLKVVDADIHFCNSVESKLKRTKKSKSLRSKYAKTLSLYEKYFPDHVGRLFDDKPVTSSTTPASQSSISLTSPLRKDENSIVIWPRYYFASTNELNEQALNNSTDSGLNVADTPKSTLSSSVSPLRNDSNISLSSSQSNIVNKEQAAKEIIVFVKTGYGKTESITIEQGATTAALFDKIKDKSGLTDVSTIVLMHGNKRVLPNGTLVDYNIQKESTLIMNLISSSRSY